MPRGEEPLQDEQRKGHCHQQGKVPGDLGEANLEEWKVEKVKYRSVLV